MAFKKMMKKKDDLHNRRSKIVDPLDWIYGIVKEHRTELRRRLKTRNNANLTKRVVAPSPSCFALFSVYLVLFQHFFFFEERLSDLFLNACFHAAWF